MHRKAKEEPIAELLATTTTPRGALRRLCGKHRWSRPKIRGTRPGIWRRWLLTGVPVRGHIARVLDVIVARAGGDHRPHHRVAVHNEVDDHRPVVDRHGLLDYRVHAPGVLAPQADATVGLGQLDEVGNAGATGPAARLRARADVVDSDFVDGAHLAFTGLMRPLRELPGPWVAGARLALAVVQVGVRIALVVEERLPLPDHTEVAVIDDRDLDRDAVHRAGGEFLVGHLETAVAVDGPHARAGAAHLGPHRRGHRVPHGAEAAGVQPVARALVPDELGGPHLVLAHAGHVHRVRAGDLADALDHVLRGQRAVPGLVVSQRVRGTPGVQLRPPGRKVRLVAGLLLGADRGEKLGDHLAAVPDDGHVGAPVLGDLGRVDVGVHDGGTGRETVQLAGDPVVEPGAQGDQQVRLLQRAD